MVLSPSRYSRTLHLSNSRLLNPGYVPSPRLLSPGYVPTPGYTSAVTNVALQPSIIHAGDQPTLTPPLDRSGVRFPPPDYLPQSPDHLPKTVPETNSH